MYVLLSGGVGANCALDGVDCASLSPFVRLRAVAGSAALFLFVALLGWRLRGRFPRAAALLVLLAPALLVLVSAALALFRLPTP